MNRNEETPYTQVANAISKHFQKALDGEQALEEFLAYAEKRTQRGKKMKFGKLDKARLAFSRLRDAVSLLTAPKVFWIVSLPDREGDGGGELGVMINGVPYFYYKWPEPQPSMPGRGYRLMTKREFGETITVHGQDFAESDRKRLMRYHDALQAISKGHGPESGALTSAYAQKLATEALGSD